MQAIRHQPSLQALGSGRDLRRRVWSGLLVLAIALASFLHVAHSHESGAPSIYKQHCTYCGTFERGAAPPPAALASLPAMQVPSCAVPAPREPAARTGIRSARQARAPPLPQA